MKCALRHIQIATADHDLQWRYGQEPIVVGFARDGMDTVETAPAPLAAAELVTLAERLAAGFCAAGLRSPANQTDLAYTAASDRLTGGCWWLGTDGAPERVDFRPATLARIHAAAGLPE